MTIDHYRAPNPGNELSKAVDPEKFFIHQLSKELYKLFIKLIEKHNPEKDDFLTYKEAKHLTEIITFWLYFQAQSDISKFIILLHHFTRSIKLLTKQNPEVDIRHLIINHLVKYHQFNYTTYSAIKQFLNTELVTQFTKFGSTRS